MSIYVKVFLAVLVGTVVAWFAIDHAINSTDRLAGTFTTSSTAHLSGREDDEKTNMVILNGEEPKASLQTTSARDAIDESLLVVNDNITRGGGGSGASAIIPRVDSKLLARNEVAELDLENMDITEDEPQEEEKPEEVDEEDELLEDVDTESERLDSDSDMTERGGDGKSNRKNGSDEDDKSSSKKKTKVIKVKKEAVQALDIAYALPSETKCVLPNDEYVRIGVDYRKGSYAIRGQSLSGIDQLIKIHRQCGGGKLLILQNDAGLDNTDDRLIQLRQDEIKYYLLQRNIPKNDMIFPDTL